MSANDTHRALNLTNKSTLSNLRSTEQEDGYSKDGMVQIGQTLDGVPSLRSERLLKAQLENHRLRW